MSEWSYQPHDHAQAEYGNMFRVPMEDDYSEDSDANSTCHDEDVNDPRYRPEAFQ